jgi:hypothetical protein
MKLTIIPIDGAVYKDNVAYSGLDLSSCGIPLDIHALQWVEAAGWLEFNDDKPNEDISSLPEWAVNCVAVWGQADNAAKNPPPPPPPTADENVQIASGLLYETDWTTIPDVSDPTKSNPYLTNSSEFLTYRNQVRQYIITPVAGTINWPVKPTAQWS